MALFSLLRAAMDLVSASVEKLRPLPTAAGSGSDERAGEVEQRDGGWLEEMEEKAERGEQTAAAAATLTWTCATLQHFFSIYH